MSFGAGSELGFGIAIQVDSSTVGQASREVVRDLYNVERAMENVTKSATKGELALQNMTKGLEDTVQRSSMQMNSGFQVMTAGMAALAPIGFGVKMAGEFEMAEIRLKTLTKSTEKTKEIMANLKEDAAKTPFGFRDLLQGNTLLIGTGLSAERAREDILSLGNAIAATGGGANELSRMAINMQQIKNSGKAASVDIKQFAYAGIDIYGLLAESMGVTVNKVRESAITYDMLTTALKKASEAGGRYENGMENMSKSIFGKFSTLKDNIEFTFAEVGKAVMPLMHSIIDMLINVTAKFQAFVQTPVGKYVVMITAALGVLLVTMGGLLLVTGFLRGAGANLALTFLKMVPATVAETFATGGLTAGFSALAVSIWSAMAPLLPFIAGAAALVGVMYLLMSVIGVEGQQWEKFTTLVTGAWEVFSSWNEGAATMSRETKDSLQKLGLLEFFQNMATWIIRIKEFGKGMLSPLIATGEDVLAVFGPFGKLFDAIIDLLRQVGFEVGGVTGDFESFNIIGQIFGNVIYFGLLPIRIMVNLLGMLVTAITWVITKVTAGIGMFQQWNASMKASGSWVGYLVKGIMFLVGGPISLLIAGFRSLVFLGESLAKIISATGIGKALGLTIDQEDGENGEVKPAKAGVIKKAEGISQTVAENKAKVAKANQNGGAQKGGKQGDIHIHHTTVVDGEVVTKTVNKYNGQQDERDE